MSKLDELKEKLNDFLTNLKSKLPGKKSSEEDEYEDEYEEDEVEVEEGDAVTEEEIDLNEDKTGEVQVDVGESTEVNEDIEVEEDEEEEDEEEDDDEEKKKKKKQLIIRAVLGLIIAYFVLDTFVLQQSDETVPEVAPIVRKNNPKKKRKKKPKKNVEEQVQQEVAPKTEAIPAAEVVADAPKAEEVPAIEEPKIQEEIPPETNAQPLGLEEAKTVEAKPEEAPVEVNEPVVEENTPVTPDPSETTMVAEEPVSDIIGEVNESSSEKSLDESLTEMVKNEEPKEEKKDLVSEDYVEPPNYKRVGRGLVYNCVGRYWSCVDQYSYMTCYENQKWNTANNKKSECFTKNVYVNDSDCAKMQQYYIDNLEPTDFCMGKDVSKEEVSTEIKLEE